MATQSLSLSTLRELPQYRQVLFNLVARDLKVKYQRSILGFVWTLVYPAAMIGIYMVVFGLVLRSSLENFWAYLIAGLLPFQFISGAVTEGAAAIRSNANLVRKIYFPAEILVIATVTAKLVEFLLQMLIGIVLVIFAFNLAAPVSQLAGTITKSTLGIATASILLSFLMMITRRKAVSQVVGFLAMENGLFFAATATTYGMPMVVELGILFDVLVATLVFGVFFFHIRETFESLDIHHLEKLKEK